MLLRHSRFVLLASLALFGCRRETKSKSSDDQAPAATTERKLIFSGVVKLDTAADQTDAEELQPGETIPGATVFLKGFPDKPVTTDETGAFTLALDLSATALTDEPEAYSIVLWYTTKGALHRRYGIQLDETADVNVPKDLGDVHLAMTRVAKIFPADAATGAPVAGCAAVFLGYEGRITTTEVDGALKADYLPPAAYDVAVTCPGYQPKTEHVTVTPPATFDDWQRLDVVVSANNP